MPAGETLESTFRIMNQAQCVAESQLCGPQCNSPSVRGVRNVRTDYGVDVDVKLGESGQVPQPFLQRLEVLSSHLVRRDIVNADLKVIQSGLVQEVNHSRTKQQSIREHPGRHLPAPNVRHDFADMRMEQRSPPLK